ncbi:hypothetical protein GCM10020331_074010 [Ectobacillus funiculus]
MQKELEIPTPVLAIVKEILQMARVKGYGAEDMSAVIKCYEEWAGIEIKKRKKSILKSS